MTPRQENKPVETPEVDFCVKGFGQNVIYVVKIITLNINMLAMRISKKTLSMYLSKHCDCYYHRSPTIFSVFPLENPLFTPPSWRPCDLGPSNEHRS